LFSTPLPAFLPNFGIFALKIRKQNLGSLLKKLGSDGIPEAGF
jgi:hypothetical protein